MRTARFEGWVDFVCPRGWCYITDSRFYGHNLSASIWHDGSSHKDQKFVIRYSQFDGVPGFPLGRHHRDAQFYLLDCIFSKNMADRPIYAPLNSPNMVLWNWGVRHYFFNCHREGGDFAWFGDNLSTAEGSPTPTDVTASWTFGGKWNPEITMPHVTPFRRLSFSTRRILWCEGGKRRAPLDPFTKCRFSQYLLRQTGNTAADREPKRKFDCRRRPRPGVNVTTGGSMRLKEVTPLKGRYGISQQSNARVLASINDRQ